MQKCIDIFLIIVGLFQIVFRKHIARLIIRCQGGATKPKVLKFFERKRKQEVDWDVTMKHMGYPLLEISGLISGIFFTIFGLLALLDIIKMRP